MTLSEALYEALRQPFGISVYSDDPQTTISKLYNERSRLGDPRLFALKIAVSREAANCVWIINPPLRLTEGVSDA